MRLRKLVPVVAVVALVAGFGVVPAGASHDGAAVCETTAIVTSTYNGQPKPRPLLNPTANDPGWGTSAQVTNTCAGSIAGANVPSTSTTTNISHCAAHAPTTSDEAVWDAACIANPPIPPTHVSSNSSMTIGGVACTWRTEGHAQFAGAVVAPLDLTNFDCNALHLLDGQGRSLSASQLIFDPTLSLPPHNCTPPPCWLNVVSVGEFAVTWQ